MKRGIWLLSIVGIMIIQALYAVQLNRAFYRDHAPFYDSSSYTNQLADVARTVSLHGFSAGIKKSLTGNVALPWLEMSVLAKFLAPSRALAIWLQAVWLTLLAVSIYWYLAAYRDVPSWLCFCLTLPFVSFARIYDWNGGLPDFRMDLSLYIFTSLSAVWYLATYETDSRVPWLLSGMAAMLACLARATAPVYLLVMLAPLLAIRFPSSSGRSKALALNCVVMCAPSLVAVGAFLLYNFDYLYFYYVTWSPDANRHLPWSESYPHLTMIYRHVGGVMAAAALAAFALSLAVGVRKRLPNLDWKMVWLALAAPLFLFIRGAGMNPFVSMPAVFGFLLFAYLPFRGAQPAFNRGWASCCVAVLAVAPSIFNALTPNMPRSYYGPSTTRMVGFQSLIYRMNQDASARGRNRVEYIAPESGDFNCSALSSVLTYEFGAIPEESAALRSDGCTEARTLSSGVTFHFLSAQAFTATDPFLWNVLVPGKTEEEKMDGLVATAMKSADYLLVPDQPTLDWLSRYRGFNYINLKTRELKTRLLATGDWVQLGDAAATAEHEAIEVYARRTK